MNDFENKLNRSHSESDLHNVIPQGSPTINLLCSRDIYKSSPTIIRRTLCIEEFVVPAGTMKPHKSSKHIFERTDYGRSHSFSFSDLRNDNCLYSGDSHSETPDGDVPMEIDTTLNYDERYPKIMGSGPGTPVKMEDNLTSEEFRYKALENTLKQRLSAQNLNKDFQKTDGGTIKCRNLADPQKLTHIKTVHERKSNVKTILFFLMAVIALFFGYSADIFSQVSVNSDVQIQSILKDLSEKVYRQQNVIDVVVRSLEQRERWPGKKKVLSFMGSQGVGKTYVANIVKQHFARNLAHEIYGSHLYYKSERDRVLDSLDDCCLNLIVIDDLKKKDAIELFAFVHSLPRDTFVLVISIFNLDYVTADLEYVVNKDDMVEVRNFLDQSGLNQELVVFRDFTIEQIEEWVRKQFAHKNVSTAVAELLLRDISDAHDIKHGLKGLHSKITLELEKKKN